MTPEPQKKISATPLNVGLRPRKDAYINRLTTIKNELQPSLLNRKKKKSSSSVPSLSSPPSTPSTHPAFNPKDIHHHSFLKIAQPHSFQSPSSLNETSNFSAPSHPYLNATHKPISGRASPSSFKLHPTNSLNSFTLLSSFTNPSPDQTPSITSTTQKSSFSTCTSSQPIQTMLPPKLIHAIPAFPISLQKEALNHDSTISPNGTSPPNPISKSLSSQLPATCLPSTFQKRKLQPNKKFRRLELVRQSISSYKSKIQVVSPLRYMITNKFKESLLLFKKGMTMDEMTKKRASTHSESQTEVTSIYSIKHRAFASKYNSSSAIEDSCKSSPHFKKASENLFPKLNFQSNVTYHQPSLYSTPIHANSSYKLDKSHSLIQNSAQNFSQATSIFKEPNFFKNPHTSWGVIKTPQFIYSKDLEERSKRIVASVETNPRPRRFTYNASSTSGAFSLPRRRSTSAPSKVPSVPEKITSSHKLHNSMTTTYISHTPSGFVADTLLSINLRNTLSNWSLKKSFYKKRKLFKGPHRFCLIPKLIRPRPSLLNSQLQAPSTRPKPLKTMLLQLALEKSTSSPIKKRAPLGVQRKQNKYFANLARGLDTYLTSSKHDQPMSLATSFSQFYYIPRPPLATPKKTNLSASLKSIRLPTPPPKLPSWAQPPPLPEKKIKKEQKVRLIVSQPTPFKIVPEEKINEPEVQEKILHQEPLTLLNEIIEDEEDIKEETVARNLTETFIPSASTFNKSQRVMFLQDFTRLTKWYEDITTKNFVNNNIYSLDVDTRKIEDFSENDFREMVWNLYYYINRMGDDMLIPPFCYKKLYKFAVSKNEKDTKTQNCRLLIKELPKVTFLNLKSIFGHSFRLSKVGMNNNILLGILYTTLGRILFPILELDCYQDGPDTPPPTPAESPSPSNFALSRPRRATAATFSFKEFSSFSPSSNSSFIRRLSLAPSKASSPEDSHPSNFQLIPLQSEEPLDIISMNIRDPIDTEIEESRLNEVKEIVVEVVTAILQGGTLEEHLSAGGILVKYLVENFESLF